MSNKTKDALSTYNAASKTAVDIIQNGEPASIVFFIMLYPNALLVPCILKKPLI